MISTCVDHEVCGQVAARGDARLTGGAPHPPLHLRHLHTRGRLAPFKMRDGTEAQAPQHGPHPHLWLGGLPSTAGRSQARPGALSGAHLLARLQQGGAGGPVDRAIHAAAAQHAAGAAQRRDRAIRLQGRPQVCCQKRGSRVGRAPLRPTGGDPLTRQARVGRNDASGQLDAFLKWETLSERRRC